MDKEKGSKVMILRGIELKLVYELMKNCRQSDRALAKKLGVSQPTTTRTRKKLEKEGIIKEYAMIPDFQKLGFNIMAFNFIRYEREMTPYEYEEVLEAAREFERTTPNPLVLALKGTGMGYNRIITTFHEDYTSYLQVLNHLRQFRVRARFTPVTDAQSFLVSLDTAPQFQPITFSRVAEYLLKKK